MSMIKLIAGLGNPGKQHERDRHNVGFWLVSRLASGERVELKPVARYHGLVGKLARPGGELRFLLPQTYMNLSGKSVGALARFYKILDRVNATDRAAFVLRFMEGLELTEVAAALKLSLATTKRRLARVWARVMLLVERDPVLVHYGPKLVQEKPEGGRS